MPTTAKARRSTAAVYETGVAVTASDSTVIAPTGALYIGAAGTLKVTMAGDAVDVSFANVGVGLLPLSVTKVYSTGTSATGIVALR